MVFLVPGTVTAAGWLIATLLPAIAGAASRAGHGGRNIAHRQNFLQVKAAAFFARQRLAVFSRFYNKLTDVAAIFAIILVNRH